MASVLLYWQPLSIFLFTIILHILFFSWKRSRNSIALYDMVSIDRSRITKFEIKHVGNIVIFVILHFRWGMSYSSSISQHTRYRIKAASVQIPLCLKLMNCESSVTIFCIWVFKGRVAGIRDHELRQAFLYQIRGSLRNCSTLHIICTCLLPSCWGYVPLDSSFQISLLAMENHSIAQLQVQYP